MNDTASAKVDFSDRVRWLEQAQSAKGFRPPDSWYKANSREAIRDETLRALLDRGAVVAREGVATTSSQPRYQLAREFTDLFEPIAEAECVQRIKAWQQRHLRRVEFARISTARRLARAGESPVVVTLPNNSRRVLTPDGSSILLKGAIEIFAQNFLKNPQVLFLTDPANKLSADDRAVLSAIGLTVDASTTLPDAILTAQVGERSHIVFVEAVYSDGAITARRAEALRALDAEHRYEEDDFLMVSVFESRTTRAFRRLVSEIAVGTHAWFLAEPDYVLSFGAPGLSARP